MSQFHNLYCRSDAVYPVTTQVGSEVPSLHEIADAWVGSDESLLVSAEMYEQGSWKRVDMGAASAEPLFILHRDTDNAAVRGFVDEVLEEGGDALEEPLRAALAESRQVIGVEFKPERLTEDGWEFLDVLQANILSELQGYLVVLGEGLFDERLQIVADLT